MKTPEKEQKKEKTTTEKCLEKLWNHVDLIGRALTGSLWRDVYETIQDAIARNERTSRSMSAFFDTWLD